MRAERGPAAAGTRPRVFVDGGRAARGGCPGRARTSASSADTVSSSALARSRVCTDSAWARRRGMRGEAREAGAEGCLQKGGRRRHRSPQLDAEARRCAELSGSRSRARTTFSRRRVTSSSALCSFARSVFTCSLIELHCAGGGRARSAAAQRQRRHRLLRPQQQLQEDNARRICSASRCRTTRDM